MQVGQGQLIASTLSASVAVEELHVVVSVAARRLHRSGSTYQFVKLGPPLHSLLGNKTQSRDNSVNYLKRDNQKQQDWQDFIAESNRTLSGFFMSKHH